MDAEGIIFPPPSSQQRQLSRYLHPICLAHAPVFRFLAQVASTSTIGTDGGHTAVREGNADSASSIKKKSGKKGKNQSKEQEASAPKAGTEGKESKIEERSKAAYPSVTKTSGITAFGRRHERIVALGVHS